MKKIEMSSFRKRTDEFNSLLRMGQKIIPLLEEMFYFIIEINPLLEEINSSITDNLKSMPIASGKLSKVTEATENASNEIINLVDRIADNTSTISDNLKLIKDEYLLKVEQFKNLRKFIENVLQTDKRITIEDASEVISNGDWKGLKVEEQSFNESFELLDKISEDSSSIMMSLQVQDITSQQIASVNFILTTIQSKLSEIWSKFNDNEIFDISGIDTEPDESNYSTEISNLHRTVAFDMKPLDNFTDSEILQKEVDEILMEQKLLELQEDNIA